LGTLRELNEHESGPLVQRAMARSYLELGQETELLALLEHAHPEAFSTRERECLHALVSAEAPAAGVSDYANDAFDAVRIGRALARNPRDALAQLGPNSQEPLALLLDLELARRDQQHDRLVQGLVDWSQQPGCEMLKISAALLAELHGAPQRARQLWQDVLAWDPKSEVAYRAAAELGAECQPLDLETLARNFQQPERVALLLLEAAWRLRSSSGHDTGSDYLRLLASAAERCPTLPFAYRWADELTLAKRDSSAMLDWLERRRAAFPEPSS
jgi:hypothetical protein